MSTSGKLQCGAGSSRECRRRAVHARKDDHGSQFCRVRFCATQPLEACVANGRARPQCLRRSRRRPSQPSFRFELGQINTGRRIPSACGVSGAELLCDFLVAIRNAQWRVCGGIALLCNWRMPRIHQSRSCRGHSRPLRRRGGFCYFRIGALRDSFAAALSGFSALVRVNPCGHSGRIGLGFVAYRNTFFPRYALGE
jgi:hypothetical protein